MLLVVIDTVLVVVAVVSAMTSFDERLVQSRVVT